MIALFWLLRALSVSPFKSKNGLAAENAALRHQLIVLQRRVHGRVQLTNGDRLFLVTLYRWFPSVLRAITIVRPETLVRWHGAGFRRYWRWKSRVLGGRPKIDGELRALIRRERPHKVALKNLHKQMYKRHGGRFMSDYDPSLSLMRSQDGQVQLRRMGFRWIKG